MHLQATHLKTHKHIKTAIHTYRNTNGGRRRMTSMDVEKRQNRPLQTPVTTWINYTTNISPSTTPEQQREDHT